SWTLLPGVHGRHPKRFEVTSVTGNDGEFVYLSCSCQHRVHYRHDDAFPSKPTESLAPNPGSRSVEVERPVAGGLDEVFEPRLQLDRQGSISRGDDSSLDLSQ